MSVAGLANDEKPAHEEAKVRHEDSHPTSQVVKQEDTPARGIYRLEPSETPVDEESAIKRNSTRIRTPPAVKSGSERPKWETRPTAVKRSRSPLPDLFPRDRGWGAPNGDGKSRTWGGTKKMKRDESPELIVTMLYSDDERQQSTSEMQCGPDDTQRRRTRVDYKTESGVPAGDPPNEANIVLPDCVSPPRDLVPDVLPSTPIGSEPTSRYSDVAEGWLLDSTVCCRSGMLVVVHGSRTFRPGVAWHRGDYEGARGIVLSVLNTGADNESFPSTARVKFLKPLHSSRDTLTVPAALLWPIQPDAEQQEALIISGQHKGHTAKLLEEVSEGCWYVSGAYDYFEIASECLVRLFPTEE